MLDLPEYGQLVAGLVAITNPLSKIPVFMALTGRRANREQHRIALVAAGAAVGILLTAFFVGQLVLNALGITIPAFRIAGGILLLMSALAMMGGASAPLPQDTSAADDTAVAVVPLATPLLAGPGAISTVIVYAHAHDTLSHMLLVVAAIVTAGVVILVVLRLAPVLAVVLRQTGMNVATRLMGLIIAATAVEFIVDGMAALFPRLVK